MAPGSYYKPADISIHALREEGDYGHNAPINSRDPISIHALREEGDMMFALWMPMSCYFYPRPPRGGRPQEPVSAEQDVQFLSTPSARRATPREAGRGKGMAGFLSTPSARRATTAFMYDSGDWAEFLSTPSARRATDPKPLAPLHPVDFYPRPPRGGRQLMEKSALVIIDISIHALREEGDLHAPCKVYGVIQFLSTPSARRATVPAEFQGLRLGYFYPRPPRGGRQRLLHHNGLL